MTTGEQKVEQYYGQHTRGCGCKACGDDDNASGGSGETQPDPRDERIKRLEEALRGLLALSGGEPFAEAYLNDPDYERAKAIYGIARAALEDSREER